MTEIIPAPALGATDLAVQMDFAKAVATAGVLPKAYQGNPGSVLVAVGLGAAMGLTPAESLYRIHVIEGKPSASAELIAANVRRAGHRLRVNGDDRRAVAQIIRADDPEFTYEVEWTIEKAQRAGLAGKSVWKSYPSAMLKNRAITECARTACPEALYGVVYTEEEARETLVDAGEARPQRESAAALIAAAAEPAPEPEAVAEPMVTTAQLKKIGAAMREAGITERTHALAYIQQAIGVEVASRSELTREQAARLIDALEQDVAQQDGDAAPEQPELPVDGGEAR